MDSLKIILVQRVVPGCLATLSLLCTCTYFLGEFLIYRIA